MKTGYATIITPIGREEHTDALRQFLRTEVEPLFERDEPCIAARRADTAARHSRNAPSSRMSRHRWCRCAGLSTRLHTG